MTTPADPDNDADPGEPVPTTDGPETAEKAEALILKRIY